MSKNSQYFCQNKNLFSTTLIMFYIRQNACKGGIMFIYNNESKRLYWWIYVMQVMYKNMQEKRGKYTYNNYQSQHCIIFSVYVKRFIYLNKYTSLIVLYLWRGEKVFVLKRKTIVIYIVFFLNRKSDHWK